MVRNGIVGARKRLARVPVAPRWHEIKSSAANALPAQVEMLVDRRPGPLFVEVMRDSNQSVQTRDYYASNQQIPQVAAIYGDHEKISVV